MDLDTLLQYDWAKMTPEFIILGVATLLSLLDMFMKKETNRVVLAYIGMLGIIAAFFFLIQDIGQTPESILFETFIVDGFSILFQSLFLLGAFFVLLIAIHMDERTITQAYRGEFYYLMLAALLGAMVLASSADFITLFVGLELLSLSSYVLAGMNKRSIRSNEAAMKYLMNGGISSAILLFGISYVFGLTGTTNLFDIARRLPEEAVMNHSLLLMIAFFMIFVGITFKIATVPFHMWAPDVYEGAPTPVTAFLSVVSKAAGFAFLLRVHFTVFIFIPKGIDESGFVEWLLPSVQWMLLIVAALTMIIGNTVALKQTNLKRLFAYSSIAHAGYLLVPLVSFQENGANEFAFSSIWFYLLGYVVMNLGAFAVIHYVTMKEKDEQITSFHGLSKKAPFLSIVMTIFLLSLAGIPGTVGFMGKVWILIGALTEEQYILASIMIGTTVISYVYYFRLFVSMFFRPPLTANKITAPFTIILVAVLCAVGTILLGIFPQQALDLFQSAFQIENFFYFLSQ